MRRLVSLVGAALALASDTRGADRILLSELLASWQGDPKIAFIELAMLADGQQNVTDADLTIDVASGDPARQRVFTFGRDVAQGGAGTRILVATNRLVTITGMTPDFVLPDDTLPVDGGRVCYRVPGSTGPVIVDCLAWGSFAGDDGGFGKPTRLTPDDRSLERVDTSGVNRTDWQGQLEPTPQNDAGMVVRLQTLCGDGQLSQGEQCDGTAVGGNTCATLGFSKGKLACAQCHFDTSRCTYCGNGAIDRGEECDGAALGDRTCAALGFTGGVLGCTAACRLTTAGCDPTFFVPGGGPRGPDCLAAWRITNGAARPGADGKAVIRQRCRNGDPGCDADQSPTTCTFTLAICFDRNDARLRRGAADCTRPPLASWTLRRPLAETGGTEGALATALLGAVAALAPAAVAVDTVTFSPPLDAGERCTAPVAVVVPVRRTVVLRSATVAAAGRPRDVDMLRLACVP